MGRSKKTPSWWETLLRESSKRSVWLQIPGVVRDGIQGYNEYANGKQMRTQLPVILACLQNIEQQIGRYNDAASFANFLTGIKAVAHFAQALQGDAALRDVLRDVGLKISQSMEAQTALRAPKEFSKLVYQYIYLHTEETRMDPAKHYYFVYHPDTDWHPPFFVRVKANPLPTNFLGMSSNLDTLCVWMLFIRAMLGGSKTKRRAHFHILVPAYRPLIIKEPLIFPAELYPLTVDGHIHNSMCQVWLNIPDLPEDGLQLRDVGNLAAPPTMWQVWAGPLTQTTLFGTWLATGSGAMGITAMTAAVAGPVSIPVFFVTGIGALCGSLAAADAVYRSLEIPTPRLLGGNIDRARLEFEFTMRRAR